MQSADESESVTERENQRMSMRIDLGLEFLCFHHKKQVQVIRSVCERVSV